MQMSWHDFERCLGEAFRRRGFTVTGFDKNGADGSADFGVKKDGERYLVHCRQWRKLTVGVTAVRDLSAVIASVGAHGGYVVTGGQFTGEARQLAASCGITLIDGSALQELMGARSAA
jgi:restriction system protein